MRTETTLEEKMIPILSPVSLAQPTEGVLAPRPATLDGVTIAFIDNGKPHFDRFLRQVERRLGERYGLGEAVHKRKPTATLPADFVEELAQRCQVVVNGLGD